MCIQELDSFGYTPPSLPLPVCILKILSILKKKKKVTKQSYGIQIRRNISITIETLKYNPNLLDPNFAYKPRWKKKKTTHTHWNFYLKLPHLKAQPPFKINSQMILMNQNPIVVNCRNKKSYNMIRELTCLKWGWSSMHWWVGLRSCDGYGGLYFIVTMAVAKSLIVRLDNGWERESVKFGRGMGYGEVSPIGILFLRRHLLGCSCWN